MTIATMNRPMRLMVWLLVVPLLALTGCKKPPPVVDGETAQRLAAMPYPSQAEYGPDLDIVVIRKDKSITLTNRTPRGYGSMQLWLNQQYVKEIPGIDIGTNPALALPSFVNRYRETFPVGSFLQPELARPVISAELYDPAANIRYRLTVQPDTKTLNL